MLILRRTQKWLLAGALLALVLPARAAEVDKYLPDEFDTLAVINVKQILESPLVKKHGLEKAKDFLKQNDEASKILEALGFDPFKDLSSVTVASAGFMPPNTKSYIIAHGQFDTAKFETKAEEEAKNHPNEVKVQKEGDHKIFEVNIPNNPQALFVGMVDKTAIVASTEKDFVVDSFARAAGTKKASVKKDMQDLIGKADGKQSLWLVVPGSAFDKVPVDDEKAKKILEKMKDVLFGLTIAKDVKVHVTINTKSADNAKELAEEIKDGLEKAKGLLAVVAGMNPALAPVVDLVGGIQVKTDGSAVTLTGEASEEVIEKNLPKKDQ